MPCCQTRKSFVNATLSFRNRILSFILLVSTLLLFSGCGGGPSSKVGIQFVWPSGVPAEGVEVEILSRDEDSWIRGGTTSEMGTLRMSIPRDSSVTVRGRWGRAVLWEGEMVFPADRASAPGFSLVELRPRSMDANLGVYIQGRIRSAIAERLPVFLTVQAFSRMGISGIFSVDSTNGTYVIPDLTCQDDGSSVPEIDSPDQVEGEWIILVTSPEGCFGRMKVDLQPGHPVLDADVLLDYEEYLVGHVFKNGGEPVREARIELFQDGEVPSEIHSFPMIPTTWPDDDGRFIVGYRTGNRPSTLDVQLKGQPPVSFSLDERLPEFRKGGLLFRIDRY